MYISSETQPTQTIFLETHESFSNLLQLDKLVCLDRIQTLTYTKLYDVFLNNQTNLFSEAEIKWITQQSWLLEAHKILDIGSGNGSYLSKLATHFPDKTFLGLEKETEFVGIANKRYSNLHLNFSERDAEIYDHDLANTSDLIFFRLTLQYLKEPFLALEKAHKYLLPGGHIVIIESFDDRRRTSHSILEQESAIEQLATIQKQKGLVNRKISLEILRMFEDKISPISENYDLVFSNLDIHGNTLATIIHYEENQDKELYFNHGLLILELFKRIAGIQIDLSKAYDQLREYVNDKNAWTSPGMHYLVLKKREP